MFRTMCKSKLHRLTVTEANLNYNGSITLDRDLLAAADILPYERVQVVNVSNGARLETYAIEGEAGSGVVCLNGAAARRAAVGDIVIVMSYAQYSDEELATFQPRVIHVDARNRAIAAPTRALDGATR